MYQMLTKGIFNSSNFHFLESSLCPCLTDIVEAINTLIEDKHNGIESFFLKFFLE